MSHGACEKWLMAVAVNRRAARAAATVVVRDIPIPFDERNSFRAEAVRITNASGDENESD